MTGPAWFTPNATERHEIVFPGAREKAAALAKQGMPREEMEAFLAEHTCTVEVKGLSAGDRALLDELRFTDEGEGKISFGEQKIRAVELCLVSWSLEQPVNRETIRSLNAQVLDLIFAAIPDGRIMLEEESEERANGAGPPPLAAVPPAPEKDTAATT